MIKANQDFKNLIPPLSAEEYEQLEKNIIAEGCRDALVTWNGIILDGHNRFEICKKHDVDFDVYEMDFDSDEDAKDWMDKNQLGRRNLTPDQRRIIIGRRYNREKKKQGTNNQYVQAKSEKDQIDTFHTADYISKESGVSAPSVKRYAKDAEFYDKLQETEPEIAEKVWSGEQKLSKVKKPHVSNNSGENEWYTPKNIIVCARNTMGSIDTDPASSELANKTVNAKTIYTKDNNGLNEKWNGNVWMNPPYSQPLIAEFSKKLVEEYKNNNIEQACVLVNNATETAWFRLMAKEANMICFTKGRVKFIDKDGKSSGAPLQGQAILYYGDNSENFKNNFKELGWIARIEE
jgi:phage N-6-adenine-methyltransferase